LKLPVITVSRYTGSGGATIGKRIAERLGATYLSTQIIGEVAQRLGISEATAAEYDERGENFVERLARILWVADPSFLAANLAAPTLPFESTTQSLVDVTRQLVKEAAQAGNAVIFGHGAQFILAGRPDVLHVRFIAPLATRSQHVMQRASISRADAERRIRDEDGRRAAYVQQYYGADWNAPDPFHLILNTATWDEEACVQLVLDAVAQLARQRGTSGAQQDAAIGPNDADR
jgi:cytidylate kinase